MGTEQSLHMHEAQIWGNLSGWPNCTRNLMVIPVQLSVEEACTKCRHPWMREALQMWLEQRGWAARQHCSSLEPQTNGVPVAS